MKRREYRGTSFNLPCNRQLWKSLGEFDALMQYVECAIISFEEKQKESKLSFQEFGAPDKPCGVGRADANPKTMLPNDT